MTEPQADAFAEEILARVAALAYEELRPHLDTFARRRQATRAARSTTTRPTTTGSHAEVVSLDARRARRVA
ncbi:hypothetical protein AB0E12_17280 [Micromonospora chersina]|uniref:hypothetical protein n=1 Tax=Micromonospora chersina TaxID=47854 RepID=UPI0033FE6AF2